MNFERITKNLGCLLGLALTALAFWHRQQLGTPEYAASRLVALEYFCAFGLALVVCFHHPAHAVAALIKKEWKAALLLLANTICGAALLVLSLWLDAPTLLRFN